MNKFFEDLKTGKEKKSALWGLMSETARFLKL
jgi:hypothetical protein